MQADLDNAVVIDLGPACIRAASNDPAVVARVRAAFASRVLAADDPRADPNGLELVVANIGRPAPNRRSRHRLLDHFGNLWFATLDHDEAAGALVRAIGDRVEEAAGGSWLKLPVLVPAGSGTPSRALLLHPWLGQSLDRLLPLLRRAGIAVHPSPQVRYDPAAGTVLLDDGTAPVAALVGTWDGIGRAEVVQWFAHAAKVWDQPNLDAVAQLSERVPYRRLDTTGGLRRTAVALAELATSP